MKKTVLLFMFLLSLFSIAQADSFSAHPGTTPILSCSVEIITGPANTPGAIALTAAASGQAPFTYAWSNGEISQSIPLSLAGINYCVTVTDAAGCISTDCLSSNPSCSVSITATNAGQLSANPTGTAPFIFMWSNGLPAQTITPAAAGNYCVTVADANGCTATGCYQFNVSGNNCSVEIQLDSTAAGTLGLFASATGQAPFSYSWNTGQSSPGISISPNVAGYCVTVTDASGCETSDCFTFSNPSLCSVEIETGFPPTGTTGQVLTAMPSGTAPFTYQWNLQNGQTQSITVPPGGTNANSYCVTVTDATGCIANDCITLGNVNCSVNIYESSSPNTNQLMLVANAQGASQFTYMWSTGELTPAIIPQPTGSGTYCVTVTSANGCTASDCHTYFSPNSSQVQGYVYLPDSPSTLVNLEGSAELYVHDPVNNVLSLFATTTLQNSLNGAVTHFSFGQITSGTYLLKILLDPDSPYFADYLPTYYGDVLEWNEATFINIPSSQALFNVTLKDGQMLSGPGGIGGLLDDGEGYAPGSSDRNNPISGASILLFDDQQNPVSHTVTTSSGEYYFENLPFGTYKIVVEIVGISQGIRWVTISPENPVSQGNDFEIGENGIVSGMKEWVNESVLQIFPNPVSGQLNLFIDSASAFEAGLTISEIGGKTVHAENLSIRSGQQSVGIGVNDLRPGVYFIRITTGRDVIAKKFVKK